MEGWGGVGGGGGGGGGWGGVNNVPLDIHLHDDLFLLIASTVPRHTDALRLIDDVGLGWSGGGGVNNVPLDIHFISLQFISFIHSFIHSFSHIPSVPHSSTHSFIHSFLPSFLHSFIHSFIQPSKPRAQPSKPRANPSSARTTEVIYARVQARQIPRVQPRLRPQPTILCLCVADIGKPETGNHQSSKHKK